MAQLRRKSRGIFWVGASLLAATLLLAVWLPCPTASQHYAFRVLWSLSGAMVGSAIPGTLHLKISQSSSVGLSATGAIAVFCILFWFAPAISQSRLDSTFSSATCQGVLPQGVLIKRSDLPASLDPDQGAGLSPSDALGRPIHFYVNYQFQPSPGIRDWTQVKPGVWIERYPDPDVFSAFRETGRTTLDGCRGTIVQRTSSVGADVFIPDKGCNLMWARFRQLGSSDWQWFGEMKDIR
jgi:hypothetical protein